MQYSWFDWEGRVAGAHHCLLLIRSADMPSHRNWLRARWLSFNADLWLNSLDSTTSFYLSVGVTYTYAFNHCMALNGLLCAGVPLRTYTLTHAFMALRTWWYVANLPSPYNIIGPTKMRESCDTLRTNFLFLNTITVTYNELELNVWSTKNRTRRLCTIWVILLYCYFCAHN